MNPVRVLLPVAVACLLLPGCALLNPTPQSGAQNPPATDPPELVADRPAEADKPIPVEPADVADPAADFAKRMVSARRGVLGPSDTSEPFDPAWYNEEATASEKLDARATDRRYEAVVIQPDGSAGATVAGERAGGLAPSLTEIEIRVQQPNTPLAATPGMRGGAANAPAASVELPADLREFVARWSQQQGQGGGFQSQLDARLLSALAGDYESARKPLDAVADEQQHMARQLVEMLIAIRDGQGGDPGLEASRVLERVSELRKALIPASDLSLPTLTICRSVLGYGLYEPIEPAQFRAGVHNEFVAYCEIQNIASQKQSDGSFQTWLDVKTSVLTRSGDTVQESQSPAVKTNWKTERHECFLAPIISLPPSLPPGDYVVKVTITDKIGGKVAEKRTALRILAGGQ